MDEFKKEFDMTSGDRAENSVTENNNDNSKSEQTAAFEMNEVSTTQENIPSQAEAKIEISDKTENTASSTETASYSYSGSALGGNARESFNQNSQYSGTNYRNQNSQSQSANTSYNTQGSTSYQSGPYSNQAYNNGFNAAYKSNGNGNPGVPYNEHINKKKTDKKSVRYVAALVAAAVLNLAVLGGAFALGHSFGSKSGTVTNKTTLSEQLKTDDGQSSGGSTGGATSTASTIRKQGHNRDSKGSRPGCCRNKEHGSGADEFVRRIQHIRSTGVRHNYQRRWIYCNKQPCC